MTIEAVIEPLHITDKEDENSFYRKLEIHMQRLGHLIEFQEELNWTNPIKRIELGNVETLQKLKKRTAKTDGVMLFYAKWTRGTIFQHMIVHPNDTGIYLPFKFDEPFFIKLENKEKVWIGSSIKLQEELRWLDMTMSKETEEKIINYWNQLKVACEDSINERTPIIFKTGKSK